MAGGTPIMFPAIAVCDGIAMGHDRNEIFTGNKRTELQILQKQWQWHISLML